jgi:Rrf2 family protein
MDWRGKDMKISTKGRYGLRALLDLAIHSEKGEVVTISSISERQDISKNYLEQVFSGLRKAEIIKGVKGPQGGYLLNEEPSQLKVGAILRVLEGNLFEVEDQHLDSANLFNMCINKNVWSVLDQTIHDVVDNITMADLMEDYKRSQSKNIMFYI